MAVTAAKKEVMKVPQESFYGTGRRKSATARVWVFKGSGKVQINGRQSNEYFKEDTLEMIMNQPFDVIESMGKYDVYCTVKGSGISGQAQAIRHGITRALLSEKVERKSTLRANGLVTRDSRKVERKKYGRKKARKSFQFSKR